MPFQKGQSGNPRGRPKGTKGRFTALKDAMLEAIEVVSAEIEAQCPEKAKGKKPSLALLCDLIRRASLKDPNALLRTVVSLLPREIKMDLEIEPVEITARRLEAMDRLTAPGEKHRLKKKKPQK